MGWKVLIDTVEYLDAVVETIEEILNGHIEATFTLPNTAENRTLVNSDHVAEIFYNDISEFKGILRAPEFQRDKLLCKCYQTAEEQGQRKVHIGNYSLISPNVIFAAICASAGIVAGVCPTTPALSVRYDRAYCYDAARYIAWALSKELYHDFSGANPRYNIGTAGTGYPSGRGILQYTVTPRRGRDRGKKRDKVYLRGLDSAGLPIVGEAGTGTEVYVGTDRTSTDKATLDLLAAKKLAELNTDASGCVVTVALESPVVTPVYVQGYDIHAGDYVIVDCAELDYSMAVVRVAKVTKHFIDIIVEVEKAEKLLDDYLEEYTQWEELGIYAPATAPDIDPVTPSGFGTDDVTVVAVQESAGIFTTYFKVVIHRVTDMTGYRLRWQRQGADSWNYTGVEQQAAGDASLYTGPVAAGLTYDLQVASYNRDGKVSAYTGSVPKLASTDITAPGVPSGVTAIGLVRQIKIYWTTVIDADLKGYKLYRHTANVPGSATEIARTAANIIIIDTNLTTPYYFWVSSFDFLGNESAKSTLAIGCPVTGQKEIVTDLTDVAPAVPTITVVAQEVDTSSEFRTWLQVTITRVTDAGGYVVSYKKTSDPQWIHFYVEQPSSGNPIATTPDFVANTSYDIHACSVSKLGLASAWCTTQVIVMTTNTTAPPVPTGLVLTAVVDGVLVEWNPVVATDFSHCKIYYGTTNPPLIVAGQVVRPYFLWTKEPAETYQLYYFAITSVDSVGNESAKCTAVSATPTQVKPIDLSIESRPWTADFKMWEDETTYGKLYWAAKDGASDAVVKFADGSTKTIIKNLTGTSYSVTLHYFYWDTTSTLKETTDYGTAVGEGKGLMAVVDVRTDRRSTVLPFNSYMPTIGAGAIAAKTILTDHIKAGQITTSLITSDVALAIRASQIVLDGSVYFMNSWQKPGDITKIDGGSVSTGTIDAIQIKANAIIAGKIAADAVATGNIQLDDLSSEPSGLRKLWYWGAKDYLCFKGNAGVVGYIPRYPLSQDTAPPENLISNQCFESDRDGNGVPDYWATYVAAGFGSIAVYPNDQVKGLNSCAVNASANSNVAALSDYIAVDPTKTLYLEVRSKPSVNNAAVKVEVILYGYNAAKTYLGIVYTSNGSRSTTVWTKDSFATVLATAIGTTVRYVKVGLYDNAATYGFSSYVLFDDVILSELRAATPTAGIIGYYSNLVGDIPALTHMSWNLVETITPTVDVEEYTVEVLIASETTKQNYAVKVIVDSTDFPGANGVGGFIYYESAATFVITIPKNVNGKSVYVYIKPYLYDAASGNVLVGITAWGHSQHAHR